MLVVLSPAGRAHQALVLGFLFRCDSCHVMSWCIGLSARACGLIDFVRVRSNSCSSVMSSRRYRRCRCWRLRRRRSGRVACWRAVRAGFVVSCRVLLAAGRRGGQPRRPCRALLMDRIHQVMTFCETATRAHCSSAAHLVSLHSRYSHQTPCEGMRSLSGGDVIVEGTIQDDSMMQHFSVCDGDGSRRTGAALITFKTESSDRAAIVERWYDWKSKKLPEKRKCAKTSGVTHIAYLDLQSLHVSNHSFKILSQIHEAARNHRKTQVI